ncbi:hypothetical protein ACIBI9_55220 [Nonomuraea sp. NPDC050451]|uniref:hypothetical protein n=1 Tax=Nonomuraea sp. NPDC050451 TaxID=3364364 RepID=UPI0037B82F26
MHILVRALIVIAVASRLLHTPASSTSGASSKLSPHAEVTGRPNRTHRRRISLGVVSLVLAIATGFGGWLAFSTATMTQSKADNPWGRLTLLVPPGMKSLNISYSYKVPQEERTSSNSNAYDVVIVVTGQAGNSADGCFPYALAMEGDAKLGKKVVYKAEGQSVETWTNNNGENSNPMIADQMIRAAMCSQYPVTSKEVYMGTVSAEIASRPVTRVGAYRKAYWAPDVNINTGVWKLEDFKIASIEELAENYDRGSLLLGPDLADPPECTTEVAPISAGERVEGAQPAPTGPGFRWNGCGTGQKTGTTVDFAQEQQANRSLFVSGVLLGAAISLLLFGVQILIDARK